MKKYTFLFCSISSGILFFGTMFTLIRTFYYKAFPSFQEYVFPLLLGTFFGTGIGLWRIQSNEQNRKLEEIASELRNANTALKRKNRKLIETRAKLELSEKMEAMGILAGGVAHDLNNVLQGIIAYPDMMISDIPDDSRLVKPLQQIRACGEKAVAIAQDLLTLARQGVKQSQTANLKKVIEQYLSSPECDKLRSFHPEVAIEAEYTDDALPVKGSSVHLYMLLMNLVSNAAEAVSGSGRIHISLETRHVKCTIGKNRQQIEGEYTILTVADTGIGISAEDMERIFEPFFTKKKMGRSGTGLGMAVVWRTVQDHNGCIDIQSRAGEGTRIAVYLQPAAESYISEKAEPPFIDRHMGEGKLVLIVDDMAEQRDMATEIVQHLGFHAVSVPSGEAAIAYFRNDTADVMLLDIIMAPGIDGVETYKGVVEQKPDIRVIGTSGYFEPEITRKLKELGVSEFLSKPYTVASILKSLKRVLTPQRGS